MISNSDMNKAKVMWCVQLLVPLFRVILSKFFYPVAYYFRVWIRTVYYNYHEIKLQEADGWYPKKKVSKYQCWLATVLWWFLDDDAGEYADCGGTEFVEKYLDNDIGQIRDPEKLGAWLQWGMIIEENITNPFRRFYCAYRWNGIRNPAYNFNRKYMMPEMEDPIETKIVEEEGVDPTDASPWIVCRFKDRNGLIDFYRSTFGKKYVFYKGKNGKTVFCWSLAKLIVNKQKNKLTGFAMKFGWSLKTEETPDFRHTFSIRKYKHYLNTKDGENYYNRFVRGICVACEKYNCDECQK